MKPYPPFFRGRRHVRGKLRSSAFHRGFDLPSIIILSRSSIHLAQPKKKRVLQGTVVLHTQYPARVTTVDPSILTAVHELGSVQASPTIKDMLKMERLLQYLSTHRNYGIRYYASNMQASCKSNPTRPISADPGPDPYQEAYST